MREQPILFSGDMVRAILAGRKTQTRRIVKPPPENPGTFGLSPIWGSCTPTADTPGVLSGDIPRRCIGRYTIHAATAGMDGNRLDRYIPCPYGGVGDRLWVREGVWCYSVQPTGRNGQMMWPKYADLALAKRWFDQSCEYTADMRSDPCEGAGLNKMFMPRWASRITLTITGLRVERLQDITEEDAAAEGVGTAYGWRSEHAREVGLSHLSIATHDQAFANLWLKLHGQRSWADNPWVWVVQFRVEEGTR